MVNFASSDHVKAHFFESATDMGKSDLFGSDGSIGLDEPELDDVMFLDSFEEMQPDSYFTSQMEMSCNKTMSLEADDVPFDLDDNITDLKDVSMGELETSSTHLSQLLRESSDKSVPGGVPSETSSKSEHQTEQPEQPGDGMTVKDIAVAAAVALGLPFVVKFFQRMFDQKDDDVPITKMADQGGNSSNTLTMSRSERMMSSAGQESSRKGAMYAQ
jgi:hypothetical protein